MTWLTDAIYYASHQITVILVGNKTDLEQDRQVLFLEASQFAQENDLIFVETSAKNGDNIEEAFLKCAKIILSRLETGEIELDAMGPGIQDLPALFSLAMSLNLIPANTISIAGNKFYTIHQKNNLKEDF
uniref:Uncharacterized protein n=1 Tax=Acrobeloides nanus TaxID=290746 RepID=A0A914EA95_9BILA